MKSRIVFAIFGASAAICLASCSGVTSDERQWLIEKIKNSLVFVKGGTFRMGDVGYKDKDGSFHYFTGDADTVPVHEVKLNGFSIQKFETTFAEFDLFSKVSGEEQVSKKWRHVEHSQGNYPAKGMDWQQARTYCQWLGTLTNLPMDLPTEAQWEYAARSQGLAVAHATDNGDIEYGRNYRDPTKIWHPMPVGSWPPNPLGLYDMTGNVSEWVLDWYAPYSAEPQINPTGPEKGYEKVTRGFGVIGGKGLISLFRRTPYKPTNTGGGHGVRCVVNQPTPVS